MRTLLLSVILLNTLLWAGCSLSERSVQERADEAYLAQHTAFKDRRAISIAGPEGWGTLVGLFWLREGLNTMGSNPEGQIVFPADRALAEIGTIRVEGDSAWLIPAPNATVMVEGRLVSAPTGLYGPNAPTIYFTHETLKAHVIERSGRLALRAQDSAHPFRTSFPGIPYYPADTTWRVEATFVPFAVPETLNILNVIGTIERQRAPGELRFTLRGETLTLTPTQPADGEPFFIMFRDATTGKQTYGSGRYLSADPPDENGKVMLDFNRAYNPPCAYTPYATCPVPPARNTLPVRVQAGEQYRATV